MLLLVAMLAMLHGPAEAAQPVLPVLADVTAQEAAGRITLTFSTTEAAVPGPVKSLRSPSRLYFDIPGFKPGRTRNWSLGAGPVRGVRAALNQPDPAVTRVVIDLARPVSWKVEPGTSPKEFRIVVFATAEPSKPEQPPAPAAAADGGAPAAAPAGATAAAPPAAPPVTEVATERRTQIAAGLAALAPTLEAMRGGDGPSDAALVVLLSRAETLAGAARALRGLDPASDALRQVAADAVLTAARARAAALAAGDAQSRANAASAAAGALLLMDRLR